MSFSLELSTTAKNVDDAMAAIEAILLAIVGRVATWIASLPCAVVTAKATAAFFELSWPWAIAVAAALELVGQSASNLWLNAKDWNATKNKSDPKADQGLALIMMIVYFAVDFAIIAAWEIPRYWVTRNPQHFTALTFPVMGVVGILTLNERVAHYRRKSEAAMEAERRRKRRGSSRKSKAATKPASAPEMAMVAEPSVLPIGNDEGTLSRAYSVLSGNMGMTGSELGRQLGVSERQGRNLRAEVLERLAGNGGGS